MKKSISFKVVDILRSGIYILAFVFPFMAVIPITIKMIFSFILIFNFIIYLLLVRKIKINIFVLLTFLLVIVLITGHFSNTKFLLYFTLFFISYNLVSNKKEILFFLKTSLFGLLTLSFLAFLSFLNVINLLYFYRHKSGIIRLIGFNSYSNPNNFALLFTLALPFIGFFYKDRRIRKLLWFIIILFPLILTQSKAVIFPVFLLSPFIFFKFTETRKKIFFLYFLFLIVLFLLIPLVKQNNYTKRILLLKEGNRFLIWKASIDLVLKNPLGYYQKDYKTMIYNKIIVDYNKYIDKPKNTHNLFLYILLQTGIIGFLIFGIFVFFLIYYSFVNIKNNELSLFFLVAFLIFFFFNFFHLTFSWFYFWMFLGVWNSAMEIGER